MTALSHVRSHVAGTVAILARRLNALVRDKATVWLLLKNGDGHDLWFVACWLLAFPDRMWTTAVLASNGHVLTVNTAARVNTSGS